MRGVRVALWEQEDYSQGTIAPASVRAGTGVLFWLPLVLGTLSYTLTCFNWAGVVTALEENKFIKVVCWPLVILFYVLIPLLLIFSVTAAYFNYSPFVAYFVLLGVSGLLETIGFLYCGKVMWRMGKLNHELPQPTTAQERKVIFIVPSLFSDFLH